MPYIQMYSQIKTFCAENQNPAMAVAMEAYMKNKFVFYGINAPQRKEMVRLMRKRYKFVINEDLWQLISSLWEEDQRECQYIALDFLAPLAKKLQPAHIPFLEKLITTKSWWDTVDGIAPTLIGPILQFDPELRFKWAHQWMKSENIWLQRTAIIFQLKYGRNTDWNLLVEAILENDTSKEFFVRKGQGWALRQFSKFDPKAVFQFVEANPQLSGLTKKEALRNIKI